MWRLLLIIIVISIAFYFIVKNKEKQQSHGRDRTNELLTVEHLKDVYMHDILDDEMKKLFYEKP